MMAVITFHTMLSKETQSDFVALRCRHGLLYNLRNCPGNLAILASYDTTDKCQAHEGSDPFLTFVSVTEQKPSHARKAAYMSVLDICHFYDGAQRDTVAHQQHIHL